MTIEKTKTPNWKRILFVASLALNLAVIGVLVGVAINGGPKERLQRFDLTVGPLTRAMDEGRRDAVRNQLRESGAFRPSDREDMRRDAAALLDTLRADTFDAQAFSDLMARQRVRVDQGQVVMLDAVTAQIAQMDAAERSDFADRIEGQMRRPRPPRN